MAMPSDRMVRRYARLRVMFNRAYEAWDNARNELARVCIVNEQARKEGASVLRSINNERRAVKNARARTRYAHKQLCAIERAAYELTGVPGKGLPTIWHDSSESAQRYLTEYATSGRMRVFSRHALINKAD